MVNVTFSLPKETVDRLRRAARIIGGGRRGALSELVNRAISSHLNSLERDESPSTFSAFKQQDLVAKASTLRGLAEELERLKIDPREVRITSSAPLKPLVRTGPRGHAR